MANIGSSPLGLTFFSTSDAARKSSIRGYRALNSTEIKSGDGILYKSIFGNSGFTPYPESISDTGKSADGSVKTAKGFQDYHTTDIYDTSISSLITYTSKYPSMKLLASDFAYLKDVGVFPNNRLMIARRFAGPVKDDLTSYGANSPTPLATLVSWTPDGNNFIEFSFGEEWESAESSFREVLNDIGKDMKASQDQTGKLGDAAASAFSAIPLPGFMEGLQYQVLNKMGLSDDKSVSGLPGGNPNLIREAKRRKTLDAETAGSGLKADVSINMKVEYEQKFINGVDPTLVYYDIIANALSFGTSESSFQFAGPFGAGVSETLQKFISGDIKGIIEGIRSFVSSLISAIADVGRDLIEKLISPPQNGGKPNADTLYEAFSSIFASTIGATIGKYKIRIQGIANALSGAYSTPWHITIGNPKKPMFSSGDMYTTDVKVTLGPILAFNDLPSSITIEFTLKNARNLGSQEIFNKFNASGGRTYRRLNLSFAETKLISPTSSSNYKVPAKGVEPAPLDGAITTPEDKVIPRENEDFASEIDAKNRATTGTASNAG
jgi:hypothetical protein